MKQYFSKFLKHLSVALEFFIATMLSIGIILLCYRMVLSLGNIPNFELWPNYDDLLETCFNLVIGVELIRMMYSHSPITVFEVLLFAIARQVIIDHSTPWSSLIGVTAIAVLFATRKFLFSEFDVADQIVFRASSRASRINKLMGTQIPCEPHETLLDVISKQLENEDTEIGIGTYVYFHDCGLRVAKMKDGKITRIELIRAVH